MKTQQEMIRCACMTVLGRVPSKGADAKAAFTAEVREKIADYMLPLLGSEWEIKAERALARARDYITGKESTDLLQNWCIDRSKKNEAKPAGDVVSVLKQAVAEGLLTKEQAEAKLLALLS